MSKFMFFDFRCLTCDTKEEHLVKPDFVPLCQRCGSTMTKLMSAPTLAKTEDQWAKQNKQKTDQDKKFYKEHGVDKLHHSVGS